MNTKNKAEVAPVRVGSKLQPPPLTGYDCPCARKGLTHHSPDCLYHSSRDVAAAQSGQHTQWTIAGDTIMPDGTKAISIIEGSIFPSFVCHCEGPKRLDHARLIAAAPELLEALKGLYEYANAIRSPGILNVEMKAARAAIAKAERGNA